MKSDISVYAAGVILLLGTTSLPPQPARAQYVNPYTGYNWNNPASSFLDTAIQGMQSRMMLSNSLASSNLSAAALRESYERQLKTGNSRIKSGKATTRITPRAFPVDEWLTRCGGTTPKKRKQILAEITTQRDIWAQEIRARHADPADMAQVLGLAFVLAWEAQTGGKATPAQYKGITQDFRNSLLKDPAYQGMSLADRQFLLERHLLGGTDPVRLMREGRRTNDSVTLQKAHDNGLRYVNLWLPRGFTHYEATPTGFQERK